MGDEEEEEKRGGVFGAAPLKGTPPPSSVVGLRRTPFRSPLIPHGGRRLCVRAGPPRRARRLRNFAFVEGTSSALHVPPLVLGIHSHLPRLPLYSPSPKIPQIPFQLLLPGTFSPSLRRDREGVLGIVALLEGGKKTLKKLPLNLRAELEREKGTKTGNSVRVCVYLGKKQALKTVRLCPQEGGRAELNPGEALAAKLLQNPPF